MTLTSLTFEELDAILAIVEHHFNETWGGPQGEMCNITGLDVGQCRNLYYKLSEMRDEV
jgi:hypothetical protein